LDGSIAASPPRRGEVSQRRYHNVWQGKLGKQEDQRRKVGGTRRVGGKVGERISGRGVPSIGNDNEDEAIDGSVEEMDTKGESDDGSHFLESEESEHDLNPQNRSISTDKRQMRFQVRNNVKKWRHKSEVINT